MSLGQGRCVIPIIRGVLGWSFVSEPQQSHSATLDLSRTPQSIEPRVRPLRAVGLWAASTFVVVVFGQLLLPQALVDDPTAQRTGSNIAVACVAFALLLTAHALYWRRIARHLRAEGALRDAFQVRPGSRRAAELMMQPRPLVGSSSWLTTAGATVSMIAVIMGLVSVRGLGSARSVDSPLLGLLYATVALAPFGIAMLLVGLSRSKLARVRRAG